MHDRMRQNSVKCFGLMYCIASLLFSEHISVTRNLVDIILKIMYWIRDHNVKLQLLKQTNHIFIAIDICLKRNTL